MTVIGPNVNVEAQMENHVASSTEELLSIARSGFGEIGYQEELLLSGYQFADFLSPSCPVREIQLAGFGQQPPSYRTASFGVLVAPDVHKHIADFMALGAPHVFVIDPDARQVDRWIFQAAKRPQLVEKINSDTLLATIRTQRHVWGPESVLRTKSVGAHAGSAQLDFSDYGLLPALEREVYQKLDQLFGRAITIASEAYRQRHQKKLEAENYHDLFRLIFRLVAAKLLTDWQHPGNWLDPDVSVVIRNVNHFYFKASQPEQVLADIAVQQVAWDEIRTGLHLQNVSLEALAYVFENTFVSRETRQAYDTHATPREVAEFMVQQLPFEAIPDRDQRTVFEPFAGHAPFLTAALGRLRSLLSSHVGIDARHEYLVRMLSGIELDSFAREIAWCSLILADYPNPNGWRIEEANAFASHKFREFLSGANIVLCNPPFGQFTAQEREQYTDLQAANKAVEVLLRVLEAPPLMLGFVLPRSFTDGRSYRAARKRLADLYGNISLIALPDSAFRFAEAETVVLLASDRAATERKWYRAFIAKHDYDQFWQTGRPTWEDVEHVDAPVGAEPQLWKDPLARNLKEQLKELTPLGRVADIHRGIEYSGSVEDYVSNSPRQGFAPGLQNVEDGIEPYIIRKWRYLRVDSAVMRRKAYLFPWHQKKVIANAVRMSRGPWRIVATVDEVGLMCYQQFHGIWPKADTPLELIAAVLNGPVANVLLSTSETTRHNRIKDLKAIPLPRLSAHEVALVRELVHEYHSLPDRQTDQAEKRYDDLMIQIDTIVLSGYALPDWLEAKLMDFIGSSKRPHSSLSFVDQLRHRHGRLVDKNFTEGLSSVEARELHQIDRLLDAAEASYYAPITEALTIAHATMLTPHSAE
jgi:type I restriction-modification system DNA methylase subunit